MSKQPKPWVIECVDYWSEKIYEGDIGVDWADAQTRCWRCGAERSLQKCHIVAKQFEGVDCVSNIIPLCAMCHDEMPDVTDPAEVWSWIKRTKPKFYGTLTVERAIAEAISLGADVKRFDVEKFKRAFEEIGVHFYQCGSRGAGVKQSSIAWALRKACGE